MVPFKFAAGAAVVAGSLALLAAPALAQPPAGSPSSPSTSAGPVSSGPLSGYTGTFATPVAPRSAVGPYRYAYSRTVYEAYSPVYEGPSPIIMTTINYPGVYGAYMGSVPSLSYSLRPSASNFYTPGETAVLPPREVTMSATTAVAPTPEPPGEAARINVTLPADAALFIQGQRMTQTGGYREFVSPPLTPGQDYTYTLRATWNENGREVAQDRSVRVMAGSRVDVNLTPPTTGSTLRPRPVPQ